MNASERNPYTPPSAAVADAVDEVSLERPVAVVRAVKILWITFALGFISATVGMFMTPGLAGTGVLIGLLIAMAVGFGVAFAISYWIYGAIYAGKNWARILMLVLEILVIVGMMAMFGALAVSGQMPPLNAFDTITSTVQWGLSIYATVLLFTRPANAWYRAMKVRRV